MRDHDNDEERHVMREETRDEEKFRLFLDMQRQRDEALAKVRDLSARLDDVCESCQESCPHRPKILDPHCE